jgi:hypothetical protein
LRNRNIALEKLRIVHPSSTDANSPILPVCDAVGGWGMQDPSSADDPKLRGWRAMVEPTIADDDESTLSRATKLIIAVAVFALGVPIGAAIAAWVMPPS